MRKLYLLVLLAVCLGESAAAGPTITTIAKAPFHLSSEATFAFMPEPNLRPQKKEFYARIASYLAKSGLKFTDPVTADYFIVVAIKGPGKTVSVQTTSVRSHSDLPPRVEEFQVDESTFGFGLWRRSEFLKGGADPLWTATVFVKAVDFRAHEEDYIRAIFSRIGESYSGHLDDNKP